MAAHPPDATRDRPLAERISTSTRAVHSRLNKLIIARLPLALPPRATDAAPYVSGLLHVAPIYITFEALWQNILDTPSSSVPQGGVANRCTPDTPSLDSKGTLQPGVEKPRAHKPVVCERIHSLLEHLHLPGLLRSDCLRVDILALTGWPDHVVESQLKEIGQMGRLECFLSHIERVVENKPHVLVAYSYILFMALFAGGRYIRASLESVGDQFWENNPSPAKPTLRPCQRNKAAGTEPANLMREGDVSAAGYKPHTAHALPLRFFHFPTPTDGEDLKREFKRRLSDSEAILTEQETHDILQEAVCIFDNMILLVHQLDAACYDPNRGDADAEEGMPDYEEWRTNPLRARLRDSVAVTRERVAKNSSRLSSSSDDSVCTFVKSQRDQRPDPQSTTQGDIAPSSDQCNPTVTSTGVELCPGLPKSMRFDNHLPTPACILQNSSDARAELAGNLKVASRRAAGMHITNWVVLAAFGAIIFGAFVSGLGG